MSTSLLRRLSLPFVTMIALGTIASAVHVEDKLLNKSVDFIGTFIFFTAKVPELIFGAVRNGESAFAGFGETTDDSKKEPDGNSLSRIGSISKAFCGSVLLGSRSWMAREKLTDRLQDRSGRRQRAREGRSCSISPPRPRDPNLGTTA